MAARQSHQDS